MTMHRTFGRIAVAAAAGAIFMTGCGGGSPVGAAQQTVTIMSFTYAPQPLSAKVGDTIEFVNDDNTDHTATADDHSFDTGRFSSGARTVTVSHAGTVMFHCDVHNFMTG